MWIHSTSLPRPANVLVVVQMLLVVLICHTACGPRRSSRVPPGEGTNRASPATAQPANEHSTSSSQGESAIESATRKKMEAACVSRPNSREADRVAESQFVQADSFFKARLLNYDFRVSHPTHHRIIKAIERLSELGNQVKRRFKVLDVHESPLWSIASLVRIGEVEMLLATRIGAIPHPIRRGTLGPAPPSMGLLQRNKLAVGGAVQRSQQRAIEAWMSAITLGRSYCHANSWTRLAQIRLVSLGVTEFEDFDRCPKQDATSHLIDTSKSQFDNAEAFFQRSVHSYAASLVPLTTSEALAFAAHLNEQSNEAVSRFRRLTEFKTGKWSIAALVRSGEIKELTANAVQDIPVPKNIWDQSTTHSRRQQVRSFRNRLVSIASPLRADAARDWETAISEAGKQCIDSEWTARARRLLQQR